MAARTTAWLVAAAAAALAAAQQQWCNPAAQCTFTTPYQGKPVTFDFGPLCSPRGYTVVDTTGHTFRLQVCGTAPAYCYPANWDPTATVGVATEFWGSTPPCNSSAPQCVNPTTGGAVCCTAPCEVLGVSAPTFSSLVPNDPTGGVQLAYTGPSPSPTDPFMCPTNPVTGQPTPRTVAMQFFCNATLGAGVAQVTSVTEPTPCAYVVAFQTAAVCLP